MGLCASAAQIRDGSQYESKEAAAKSRKIEKQNQRDNDQSSAVVKLLLLGAGESGKSTIFKQMRILYGVGYTEEKLRAMIPIIYSNAISCMKILIEQGELMGFIDESLNSDATSVKSLTDDAEIDLQTGALLDQLWNHGDIKKVYDQRHKFQLADSADYYLNKILEIAKSEYVPSVQDVLRSRVRTSGIVEERYLIDSVPFHMYDVGGQRNERKKWIHCFDTVTAVIFVAAISEYDQVLYEDHSANRIQEALALFEEICNSRWFEDTSIILFLNKRDLFEQKIALKSMESMDMWKDCTAGNDPILGIEYLKQKFLSLNQTSKDVYAMATCATDTKNVEFVFTSCKDIILKKNLMSAGFL